MAIEKMKFVNLYAPLHRFDEVCDKYIADSNIHLEDALNVVKGIDDLYGFGDTNPYMQTYRKILDVCEFLSIPVEYKDNFTAIEMEEAEAYLADVLQRYKDTKEQVAKYEKMIDDNSLLAAQLSNMSRLDVQLDEMFHFEFMRFRFGRMTKESYLKLTTFLNDLEAVFIKGSEELGFVYGMYLTPRKYAKKVDNIFASLNFERIKISDKATGTPVQALAAVEKETEMLRVQMDGAIEQLRGIVQGEKEKLLSVYSYTKRKFEVFNLRDVSAHTKESFYITGWIQERDLKKLMKKLDDDEVILVSEDVEEVRFSTPPTVIRNHLMFRPFEMFVKMYGLPSYNEIDPTPFLAITYIFMYGMMFGDLGQGLVLALGGAIVYFLTKNALGAIACFAGMAGALFGLVYGSVFGNEHLIHGIWIKPLEQTNQLLITAVVLGAILLLGSMIFNSANAIKSKQYGKLLFNQNGLAGMIFYGGVIYLVYRMVISGKSLNVVSIICFVAIPLLLIFLQEPLSRIVARRRDIMPENKGEYFTESTFELMEVLLGYVTNTISFIRVGAFALIHAGMMMVVWEFGDMMSGAGSILLLVFGNLFVMGMEGFLVGIQVLRLEFYEMFGRFFDGEGKAFQPFNIHEIKRL